MENVDFESILEEDDGTNDKWLIPESKLDKTQRMILDKFDENILVEGGAGSGKTILAIYKLAKILNEDLGTYTFIVYTLTLRDFIKSGIQEIEFLKDKLVNLRIYYREEAEKLMKENKFENVDYVLIDEVQDLGKDFIKNMLMYTKKKIILLGDDKQQLYGHRNGNIVLNEIADIIKSDKIISLNLNYRVPKAIAKFSGKIIDDNGELYNKCVKDYGYDPKIVKCNSILEELDMIKKMIQEEYLSDVAILVPGNKEVLEVKEYFESTNFKVEYKYNDHGLRRIISDICYYSSLPKVMTYHSAKGLEFDYVFLPGCEEEKRIANDYFTEAALYVACTRTKKRLYISYSNKLCSYIKN